MTCICGRNCVWKCWWLVLLVIYCWIVPYHTVGVRTVRHLMAKWFSFWSLNPRFKNVYNLPFNKACVFIDKYIKVISIDTDNIKFSSTTKCLHCDYQKNKNVDLLFLRYILDFLSFSVQIGLNCHNLWYYVFELYLSFF